jgi:hypothetical protein
MNSPPEAGNGNGNGHQGGDSLGSAFAALLDLPRFRGQFSVLVSDLARGFLLEEFRQQRSLAPEASEALECDFAQEFAGALVRS